MSEPKIHPGGAVVCPECGEFRMFITEREFTAKFDHPPYELQCGNTGCLWEGEL